MTISPNVLSLNIFFGVTFLFSMWKPCFVCISHFLLFLAPCIFFSAKKTVFFCNKKKKGKRKCFFLLRSFGRWCKSEAFIVAFKNNKQKVMMMAGGIPTTLLCFHQNIAYVFISQKNEWLHRQVPGYHGLAPGHVNGISWLKSGTYRWDHDLC